MKGANNFMYNAEFISFINTLPENYKSCLYGYLEEMINNNDENINSIILFGGLVREKRVIQSWSDIDILIIYNDITSRNIWCNSCIKSKYESKFSIRIDLNEIDIEEILSINFISVKYNSELTNALSFRKDVSMIVFGECIPIQINKEHEKITSLYYINNTINQYRKFLVDNLNRGDSYLTIDVLPRIIRWVFSIIRASLRLFDIYVHPYSESVFHLQSIFPDINISILDKLLKIREGKLVKENKIILNEIDIFLSIYVNAVRSRYYEKEFYK
jgi:predicted nucleotidyltransferase